MFRGISEISAVSTADVKRRASTRLQPCRSLISSSSSPSKILGHGYEIVIENLNNRRAKRKEKCLGDFGFGIRDFFSSISCLSAYELTLSVNSVSIDETRFYRVEANNTVLWFQLCDVLIFNHDPPRCVGCEDCGGPSHCGTSCSALVSENVRGYDVCSSLGHASSTKVDMLDKEDPGKGVIVKMSSGSRSQNCSLSVSVICQKNKVDGLLTLVKSDICHYATELRHPSGCAVAISGHGSGWGWFSTLLIITVCLFGAYLIGGALYRYFSLGIRGTDVIPNLDFWTTVPHRTQSWSANLIFSGQLLSSYSILLIYGLETNPGPCFDSFNKLETPTDYCTPEYCLVYRKGVSPFHPVMS
ncbi:unnamed protein product [Arabis nemorensis]|uniref:Autophagy-related protein 27 n=1 Tax=Arabis nemorensis TaxID=586526 RepID=A0A565BMN3_9BRAS|nr:unnamed protein product [Arabis nemorensis]